MGVPALFRWLSKKYPKIVERVVEDKPIKTVGPGGVEQIEPVDYRSPNPNGFEVDNLYLDMNGIVHPCTHPEGKPAPETEEEMMIEIFNYTERVVSMARPRKVLMMAIDGVAPRAKMNQQRSRRFRAAQEAQEKEESRLEAVKLFEEMGHSVSAETQAELEKKGWDTNAITPGTPFMDFLALSLRYWVSWKLNNDPGWKNLDVIISDASVPGEGEHKIMDWIRRQRSYPEHDPNTSHVIYGLDADLIMLALATHEPHFKVLREDVFYQQSKDTGCRICGQNGHYAAQCTGQKKVKQDAHDIKSAPVEDKPFIFLDVSTLREYLAVELDLRSPVVPFDLERAIDDWVFLIFFVGNDFLPHLPSLEIREGAIDTLLRIWKREFETMGGYVTNHGQVVMDRAQIILEGLAAGEDAIFQRRKEAEERQNPSMKRQRYQDQANQEAALPPGMKDHKVDLVPVTVPAVKPIHQSLPSRPNFAVAPTAMPVVEQRGKLSLVQTPTTDGSVDRATIKNANMSAADALRARLAGANSESAPVPADQPGNQISVEADKPETQDFVEVPEMHEEDISTRGTKRKAETDRPAADLEPDIENTAVDEEDEEEAPPNPEADQPLPKKKLKKNPDGTVDYEDTVKLWEPGYRERYYREKFGIELSDLPFRSQVVKSYMEGMNWVLHYYFQGTPSWQWYYPFHYAPFAADFKEITDYKIEFTLGKPFKPFEQLMGVFPAASKKHLPEPYQNLMVNEDSPILDFYPEDFEIDMNGKKMAWQGIALLPFIAQDRLLSAIATVEPLLTPDEARRNSWGDNVMLIADGNDLYSRFCELYTKKKVNVPVPIDGKISRGVCGAVLADPKCIPGATFDTPLSETEDYADITDNKSLSVRYYFPKLRSAHRSMLLPGVKVTTPILTEQDREQTRTGRRGGGQGNRGRGRGNYNNNSGYSTPSYGSPARGGYSAPGYNNVPAPHNSHTAGYAGHGGGPALGGTGAYNAGYGYGGNGGGAAYGNPYAYNPAPNQQAGYNPSYGYGGYGNGNTGYPGGQNSGGGSTRGSYGGYGNGYQRGGRGGAY